jgi:N-sulfoglucosamine sulfohydrolase
MFLSDHGIAVPFAKTNVWMHSTRIPWIIRWPGIVAPGSVDTRHLVSGIDLAPTILDLLRLPPLVGADGRSFVPLLYGETQEGRELVFVHMNATVAPEWFPMRAVNDARFGYIYNAWADGEKEFFNNSMRGLTFPAMREAAANDLAIAARVEHLLYRTKEELYDYRIDPDALVNLIADPTHADRINSRRDLLLQHMRSTDDPEMAAYEEFLATVQ